MEIRLATLDDLDSISKLDSFWTKKQLKEELDNPSSSIFIIASTSNKDILAFIGIRLIDNICDIMNIAVREDCRNKGIGTNLLSYILNNIKCSSFNLEVSANNIYAAKLYKKLGFNSIHVRKNYYEDSDAIIMQKTI